MIWCKYMALACKHYSIRKKGKANKFKMNNLYGSDLHYSTIQQHRKVWFYGSGCVLFMHVRWHLIVVQFWPCPYAFYIWWVAIVSEYLMKPWQALPLFFQARSQWKTLSLSQPSVGISEGGLKSQAALPLSSIVHSTLHGSESRSLTARPNRRWWKRHNTPCTVMLIPQLNYTPKQRGHC